MSSVTLDRTELPILHVCDVVVVGGSLAGVAAAVTMARAGRKVSLVEPRTYLGREITATLRPWIRIPTGTDLSVLPDLIVACIGASNSSVIGDEYPLHLDEVKIYLEDLLIDAGVKLVYASLPVGLCAEDGELRGVIIGNKSGRQVLTCRLLIDATETALIARLTGAEFETEAQGLAHFSYTLEFDGVASVDDTIQSVPHALGMVGDRVIVHRGYRGQGHVLVELELALPNQVVTAVALTQREVAARQRAVEVASYLLSQVSVFRGAHLAAISFEVHGPCVSRMIGPEPEWAVSLHGLTIELDWRAAGQELQIPVSSLAGPITGLWCLNEAARVDASVTALIRDPIVSSALGAALAQVLDARWETCAAPLRAAPGKVKPGRSSRGLSPELASVQETQGQSRDITADLSGLRVQELEQPQRGRHYAWYSVRPSAVPVIYDADVLVVGGGTSGAVAAIVSAQEGMHTGVVDMNPGLGGTGTYGGVDSYWFGNRFGFVAWVEAWVDEAHVHLSQPKPDDLDWPLWNIEAKVHAWQRTAQDAGVGMLLNALVIGTIVQGNGVRGVVVATRTGPAALLGQVVIDATGDGDVAAYAGAEYTYGSTRDHAVMWYSLPQFGRPGRTWNNFTSMVDVSNVEDYTRAILSGRRRGNREQGGCHDHGIYVAPRESRHVWGDAVLTITDHLLHRCWPDVVCIAFSNNDIKGQISSDWMRIGLIPPHLEIEIPYRVLLPRGLEDILVVGKAVSAPHDSLSAVRMQPDLENLGGVAGLAAAMAVREGKTPRAIDVKALQARLVEKGVLPEQMLDRELVLLRYTDAELEALIGGMAADRPLHTYSDMELDEVYLDRIPLVDVCCAGPHIVPMLEKALGQERDFSRRVPLARALALVGSTSGVGVLISAIQKQLAGDQLPECGATIRHAHEYAPDQAAMPHAACLLYSLGMARDSRALPVWQRVVDLLATAGEEDVWSRAKGVFHYVDALCTGAEQLGDPAAIPILKQLHSYAPFHRKELLRGFQADCLKERAAYLEVVIGRALARCGSPDGVVILINYLNDVRTILAEHAHDHLVAATGQDFGKDVAAWSQWLEMEGETLQPVPWSEPTDPVKAWGETVLTVPVGETPEQRVQIYKYKIAGG
jgi:flavin-dependent dehydrogenase